MSNFVTSIQAFQDYFLSVKPFHTKILNILQRYAFFDIVNASIPDSIQFNIDVANSPLCKQVGFGISFDDCCGFSATQCCDLFSCIGGFGIIFDNSILTNSQNLLSVNGMNGTFIVPGNQTYDTRIQILSYVSSNSISVAGDQTAYLNKNQLFYIIPYNVYNINTYTTNSIILNGNFALQINQRKEVIIYGSGINDGTFYVISSIYNPENNTTSVVLDTSNKQLYPNITNMMVQFKQTVATYNDGLYQSISATFNGINTVVTLNSNVNKINFLNSSPGSILLHTGFLQNRIVTIENNNSNNGDYSIQFSSYDYNTNQTTVQTNTYLNENFEYVSGNIQPSANLYGYLTGPGFDGTPECNIPKDFNINTSLSEKLNIQIIYVPSPTPSPTPSVTPSPALLNLAPVLSNVISFSNSTGNLQVNSLSDSQNNVVSTANFPSAALTDRILVLSSIYPSLSVPTNGYYGTFFGYKGSLIFIPTNTTQYGVTILDPALGYIFNLNQTSSPTLPTYPASISIDSNNFFLWVCGTDNNLYCYLIYASGSFIGLKEIQIYDISGQISSLLGNQGTSYGNGSSFGLLTFPTGDICILSYDSINIFKPIDSNTQTAYRFLHIQLELIAQYANGATSSPTIFADGGIKVSQYSTLNAPYLFCIESHTTGVDSYLYSYNPDNYVIAEIASFPYGTYISFMNDYVFVANSTTLTIYIWDGAKISLITSSQLLVSPLTVRVAWVEYNLYRISTFGPESFDFDGTSLIPISVNENEWNSSITDGWAGMLIDNQLNYSPQTSTTPSITISPTLNSTVTPTPSYSRTPYLTPTITPTLSITPTVTFTPSLTPTISVTISTSPSLNTSPTPTPTETVFASVTVTPTIS